MSRFATSLRLRVGRAWSIASQSVLASPAFPLTRYVPIGGNWMYDVQRFAGTRNLKVIFDIGANEGQTAWGLVRYFPTADIYCFEPIKSTMDILQAKYARYPNLRFAQTALGSASGSMSIPLHHTSVLNTLVANQPATEDLSGATETIEIDTLDAYCARERINRIDVLKIDVQGWEMEVFRGGRSMVEQGNVGFILAEAAFRRAVTDMQYFAEQNDYLEKQGFRFCGFYDVYRVGPQKRFASHADALYQYVGLED